MILDFVFYSTFLTSCFRLTGHLLVKAYTRVLTPTEPTYQSCKAMVTLQYKELGFFFFFFWGGGCSAGCVDEMNKREMSMPVLNKRRTKRAWQYQKFGSSHNMQSCSSFSILLMRDDEGQMN